MPVNASVTLIAPDAGTRRYSVDMHGAGAAKCNAAAEFGAGHTEHVAQHPEEWRVGIDIDTVRGSVHDEFHDRPRSCATPRDVGAPKKLRTASFGVRSVICPMHC